VSAVRRPREPVTLAEIILHTDSLMAGADALSDVELPADLWLQLVSRAELERDMATCQPAPCSTCKEPGHTSAGCPVNDEPKPFTDEDTREAPEPEPEEEPLWARLNSGDPKVRKAAQLERDARLDSFEREPKSDAHPADCTVCKKSPYLVRVDGQLRPGHYQDRNTAVAFAKSCGWSKFEVVDAAGKLWGSVSLPTRAKSKKKTTEPVEKEPERSMVDSLAASLDEDCGRRLNGAGWKRTAAKARAENDPRTCHHCGVGADEGGIARTQPEDTVLPQASLCTSCRRRLVANPREWDRHTAPPAAPAKRVRRNLIVERTATAEEKALNAEEARLGKDAQQTIEDAIARKDAKPVKFPLGTGALERCTVCTREQGLHDGNRCPEDMHGAMVPLAGATRRGRARNGEAAP
jgi:hypothetical protein